jgi:hypothetical protein
MSYPLNPNLDTSTWQAIPPEIDDSGDRVSSAIGDKPS